MDKLLGGARLARDKAERKKFYDQIEQILVDEKPIIYLWHAQWFYGFTSKLDGFVPYPDGLIRVGGMRYKS